MKQFFEGVVAYLPDGADKPIKQIYLIDGVNYTEAEAHATKYMVDFVGIENFSINRLGKVAFDDIIYRLEDDDYNFHEITVKFKIEADKERKENYLVAGKNTEDAIQQVREYAKDTDGEWRISSAKERVVDDIILFKLCCEQCDTCESNVRVISFEEQKDLERNIEGRESIRKALMDALGAFEMTYTKFKVKATRENLKKYCIGKRLAGRVLKTWSEDFVDEDNGDVVSIERNEVILDRGTYIESYHLDDIEDSGVEFVTLYKA